MIGRGLASRRPTSASASVLGVLACAAAALALSATPALAAEACANAQLRQEANTNPATGQPYSTELPECRAYEMVSPLYKQAHDATAVTGVGFPVAPDGDTSGFGSEGDFAEPENYRVNTVPGNMYLSQRGASSWTTSSAFAPSILVDSPFLNGLDGDSSLDLRSVRVSCGSSPAGKQEHNGPSVVYALRQLGGSWVSTPIYTSVNGILIATIGSQTYLGGSSDLSRVVIQPPAPLLPLDNKLGGNGGIYEIAGVGTASPELRLVNLDSEGKELALTREEEVTPPLLGDNGVGVHGSTYHAISKSGGTVFFTATPAGSEIQTVYARVGASKTVAVSNPSVGECKACKALPEPKAATFQGASADGSKVFFTTEQQLLNKDPTTNLYEYDVNKPEGEKLVLLSADEEGANVRGVVRMSPDGSRVYFVAGGVLTKEKNGEGKEATAGQSNLYGYDTLMGETMFVGTASVGGIGAEISFDTARHAQTTPDGRYLLFSSPSRLAGDLNKPAQAVYRYDFQTGKLTWVSHGAPGFKVENEGEEKYKGEGGDALVAPLPASASGAYANIDDWNRAISEDGSYIIFTTAEKLQANDVNSAPDVYEWHAGTVSMISDGRDPLGISDPSFATMSASGSDILFSTHTPLVGQDSDVLGDVYDARVGGGFPAPAAESSCSREACQGISSGLPSFGSATSSSFTAGGNLTPPKISVAPSMETKHTGLTRAQKLARALKACKRKPRKKRRACESQARKTYGGRAKAKRTHRRGR